MPKEIFSGTFRGGSTVAPGAAASGIASAQDIGTQGNYDTDVFRWSGATSTHKGGPRHDALKDVALLHVQQERMRRAHHLAEKADQQSKILQKRLGSEVQNTLSHNIEQTKQAVLDAVDWTQGYITAIWENREQEEAEEDKIVQQKGIRGQAAVCEIIARNAKEAAFRAEAEIMKARNSRQAAKDQAKISRNLPPNDRQQVVDNSGDDKVVKLPSTLKVTISEAKNFPKRPGNKYVNPYAVITFFDVNEKDSDDDEPNEEETEVQTAVTPIFWKTEDPFFLFNYDFFVVDDWDDEVRPEEVEIKFYDCASTNITKPVVGDDPLVGMLRFPLREVCKRVQPLRWPDGREEPGHFRSDMSKWCDVLDEDGNKVEVEVEGEEDNLVCQALIGIQYLDSAKKPKIMNTIQAVQMPTRKPIPAPAPRPPPSWVGHPAWEALEEEEK
mmetsp:Transcript_57726/g.135793  ORF Transcript_57726/g.135793 Transcript_57726/m.135793 type:complete len:441 (+) Transcript_57726:104-1426(+)